MTGIKVRTTVGSTPPANPPTKIVMTFDDNTRGHLTYVAPIMAEVGGKVTFFCNSGQTFGNANYLSWAEVQQLGAAGHEIAGHTRTHDPCDAMTAAQVQDQIVDDYNAFVAHGITPHSFAWPYTTKGNDLALAAVQSLYHTARGGPQALQTTSSGSKLPWYEPVPPVDPYWWRIKMSTGSDTTGQRLIDETIAATAHGSPFISFLTHFVVDTPTQSNQTPASAIQTYARWAAANGYVFATVADVLGV